MKIVNLTALALFSMANAHHFEIFADAGFAFKGHAKSEIGDIKIKVNNAQPIIFVGAAYHLNDWRLEAHVEKHMRLKNEMGRARVDNKGHALKFTVAYNVLHSEKHKLFLGGHYALHKVTIRNKTKAGSEVHLDNFKNLYATQQGIGLNATHIIRLSKHINFRTSAEAAYMLNKNHPLLPKIKCAIMMGLGISF